MPTRRFLVGQRLFALMARRAAPLRLTPAAYLRKLLWRDLGQAQEQKVARKFTRQRKRLHSRFVSL
jgi:hypothetical protein